MPLLQSLAERALRRRLAALRAGNLVLRDGAAETRFGEGTADAVVVEVRDRRFYPAVVLGGSVGVGESYAEGWWTCPDPAALVRLFLRNRDALEGLEAGWAWPARAARGLAHLLRRNTRSGSRRNIGAHYDLSNEFFAAFLDDTLTYSCGFFERPDASLREASLAKYERICRLADLSSGHHVLEIGTGWGGFAVYAARRYGCRVTTTTISREQFALATRRVAEAGLADRVTVLDRDYRDLTGRYDRLVSIEMVEAVGPEYLGVFFERCAALLVPEGRMALQAITVRDDRYEAARREADFIKRHIFPGGTIFSLTALCQGASRTDLRLLHAEDIGPHYAETLRRWRANLRASWARLVARGFDERLLQLWEFYFCYCEGGFSEGYLGEVQLAFARPGAMAARALWDRRGAEAG